MRPLKYTDQDIEFSLNLIRDGVKLGFIARYVYGVNKEALRQAIKKRKSLIRAESRLSSNIKGTLWGGDAE